MRYTLNNFYTSKEWQLLRINLIYNRLNDKGETICEYCGESIVNKYECIGHHVEALTEVNVNDANISLNPENIQLVHHVCHNKIHNKLGYIKKQVYLVYGPPLAGKTTFVKDNMECGDLIVDIDSIWQCVSGCERYIKPNRLMGNVFSIRDLLIEHIKHRYGKWNNAYIIGGYPLIGERERLIKMLGAREIFIACSHEECLIRLKENDCDNQRDISAWEKYIDDWFRKYTPRS